LELDLPEQRIRAKSVPAGEMAEWLKSLENDQHRFQQSSPLIPTNVYSGFMNPLSA